MGPFCDPVAGENLVRESGTGPRFPRRHKTKGFLFSVRMGNLSHEQVPLVDSCCDVLVPYFPMPVPRSRESNLPSKLKRYERESEILSNAYLSHVPVAYVLDRVGSAHELHRRTGFNRQTIRRWGERVPKKYLDLVLQAIMMAPPMTGTRKSNVSR